MTAVKTCSIKITTSNQLDIIDITSEINDILKNLEIDNGIVNVFTKHSTTAIVINENEKGLLIDFKNFLNEIVKKDNNYLHDKIDNNAHSHLKSFLLSSSETIPILNSKLNLGVWQSVFLIELDGPRNLREIVLTIIA